MSLLEDVFLEDEAGEAQELERVIEGDELDERPRTPDSNDDSEKEDEAEEDKRVVDHNAKAKRVVKNPRFILNPARLTGPRGIQIIPEHFKDFQFKGKGHEREDLDFVLKKLEHWAYRLYPKFKFEDCLKKIETLGKKRPVMVHLHKIRTDQFVSEETVQQQDSSGDEAEGEKAAPEEDEFDRLLQQQIELARATPAPGSVRKEMHTPMSSHRSPLMVPKPSSSPSISDEQKERMIRNRKLAEERRLARLNQLNNTHNETGDTHNAADHTHNATHNGSSTEPTPEKTEVDSERVDVNDITEMNNEVDNDVPVVRKQNRTNVIDSDSSDSEGVVLAINESMTAQVHNSVHKTEDNSDKENAALDAMVVDTEVNSERVDVNDITEMNNEVDNDVPVVRKQNRTNVIDSDSSDSEGVVLAINESMTAQVHNSVHKTEDNSDKENSALDAMVADTEVNSERVDVNDNTEMNNEVDNDNDVPVVWKHNRTNVIDSDSSDNEGDVLAVNESISVQVHNAVLETDDSDKENTPLDAMLVESEENASSTDVPVDTNKSIEHIEDLVRKDPKGADIVEANFTSDKTTEDGNTEDPKETDKTSEDSNINTETASAQTVLNDATDKENAIIISTEANKSTEAFENKEIETGTEELMDVDFSDEF